MVNIVLSLLAGKHHCHTAQASCLPPPSVSAAAPRSREEIPDFSDRQDEIGNLSVALRGYDQCAL
jgi:two-component system sensor histidine kinase ChvG